METGFATGLGWDRVAGKVCLGQLKGMLLPRTHQPVRPPASDFFRAVNPSPRGLPLPIPATGRVRGPLSSFRGDWNSFHHPATPLPGELKAWQRTEESFQLTANSPQLTVKPFPRVLTSFQLTTKPSQHTTTSFQHTPKSSQHATTSFQHTTKPFPHVLNSSQLTAKLVQPATESFHLTTKSFQHATESFQPTEKSFQLTVPAAQLADKTLDFNIL